MTITREQCLDKAKECVMKDRNSTYGSPEDSFQKVANLWEAYKGTPFTSKDVALMLALLKVGRLSANPTHDDSWVDLAGYAACGSELGNKKLSHEESIYEAEEKFRTKERELRNQLAREANEGKCKKISVMTEKERNLKGPLLTEWEKSFQKYVDSLDPKDLLGGYRERFPYPWDNPVMCGLGVYQDIDAVVEAHKKVPKND